MRWAMTRRRALVTLVLALVASLASGCGFNGLYGTDLPGGADLGGHPYTVTIHFADVLDLVPQSAVKVNDVAVGQVRSIALDGWSAKVTVEVNGKVRLPANSRAEVKMTSLLGEKYVALEPPLSRPSAARLHDGASIPLARTGSAPEVEQVLGALSLLLNGGGLQQIRQITSELNQALRGHEGELRGLLDRLNSFLGTLDAQKQDITDALDALDRLSTTLNAQKRTIAHALDTLPAALRVLHHETGKLVRLLSSLSGLGSLASRVVTETRRDLVSSLRSLAPVLEQLTAAGSDLPNALTVALTFPFRLGTSNKFVKGDYANLHLYLDLNLADSLCGLNRSLCGLTGLAGASTSASRLAGGPGPAPGLVGAGGR